MAARGFLPRRCGLTETYPPPASQNNRLRNLRTVWRRTLCGHVRGDRFRRQSNRLIPEHRSCRRTARFTHTMRNLDHAAHGTAAIPPGAPYPQSVCAGKSKLGERNRCGITAANCHNSSQKLPGSPRWAASSIGGLERRHASSLRVRLLHFDFSVRLGLFAGRRTRNATCRSAWSRALRAAR